MGAASKIRKVLKWVLGIFVLLFIVFFYGVVPRFLVGIITRPNFHFHDQNDNKTPKDFGMDYQAVEFQSTDGVLLKGWYVPAGSADNSALARGTIVYCHGLNRSRVEMLPEAAFAHKLGFNGVLFDLRHQGQSGGAIATVGYQERHDVEGAINFALTQEKAQQPVIVWGVSMGAAAALMAAAETPDVAGVISDSTFLNFRELVRHHYWLFLSLVRRQWWWFPQLPAFPLADEVMYWTAARGHFKVADFDLERAVKEINPRPVLFVAVEGDQRMPPWYAQTLYADSDSPKKAILIVGGSRHGEGFTYATKQYGDAVKQFLGSLAPPSPAVSTGR